MFDTNIQFFMAVMIIRISNNSFIANKRRFVEIIAPSWGLSYQFDWHTINRSRR